MVVNRCRWKVFLDEFDASPVDYLNLVSCRHEHSPTEMMCNPDMHAVSLDMTLDRLGWEGVDRSRAAPSADRQFV